MAYGNLKKRYLSALQEGPAPYSYEERDAASLAEEQITGGLSTSSPPMSRRPALILAWCRILPILPMYCLRAWAPLHASHQKPLIWSGGGRMATTYK